MRLWKLNRFDEAADLARQILEIANAPALHVFGAAVVLAKVKSFPDAVSAAERAIAAGVQVD
jgi:hypothetical protein